MYYKLGSAMFDRWGQVIPHFIVMLGLAPGTSGHWELSGRHSSPRRSLLAALSPNLPKTVSEDTSLTTGTTP